MIGDNIYGVQIAPGVFLKDGESVYIADLMGEVAYSRRDVWAGSPERVTDAIRAAVFAALHGASALRSALKNKDGSLPQFEDPLLPEFEVKWCECPTNSHSWRILYVLAESPEAAKELVRDYVKRELGIGWMTIEYVQPAKSVPAGRVLPPKGEG